MEPGTQLGPYEIIEPLGSGGMGEVYRARDPGLKRDVAIKVLPEAVAGDRERIARLKREAHALAALNHPNVATIHSLEETDEAAFLVLELLEGETLAGRLRSGALPVEEALELAIQIAEGLEAAHARGIIHRDLKPANVKITPEGRVKVLDFGLARPSDRGGGRSDLAETPTATVAPTGTGVLMGTAGYMSPEQVRQQALDERTDIWAFGCVLYEMLSGKKAFARETVSDTLAAVLEHEPQWEALPESLPCLARQLLERCLRKDPGRRLHHIADARIGLEETDPSHAEVGPGLPTATLEEPEAREFRLGEELCRQLDRRNLDPRMIGHSLQYVDNMTDSEVLVIYVHGLGMDHGQFRNALLTSPHRGLAPTMVGCEPESRHRFRLGLEDHATIMREFVREAIARLRPSTTVLVGFSSGADLGFELLRAGDDRSIPAVDGFLAVGCNVNRQTCFVTRRFAELPGEAKGDLLELAQSMVSGARNLHEWLAIAGYLVTVFDKFETDVASLRRFSEDIVAPFESSEADVFVERYRNVDRTVRQVRCVFEDEPAPRDYVLDLRLRNLDTAILGDRDSEGSLIIEPETGHFELLGTDVLGRHVAEMVESLASSG